MEQKYHNRITCAALALIAVCFTLLFCNSSILIGSFGRDSSVFYTIGRGIVQGKVAYKDLFDHKGLYLYLLNALGVLISDWHMLGLWLVETLFVLADCFLISRITRKMGLTDRTALLTVLLTMAFAACYWEGGNLTETYGLLPELISFSVLLNMFQDDTEMSFPAPRMFVLGICAGVELFLRANMVMAWIPVAVIVIGLELRGRRLRNAWMIFMYGLLGVLTASAIPLVYCLKHDCLAEMFFASVLFNLRYLANGPRGSAFLLYPINTCFFLVAFLVGTCSVILGWWKWKSRIDWCMFAFSFLLAVVSVLLSGRLFVHYNLYLLPFVIPFLSWIEESLQRWLRLRWRLVLLIMIVTMTIGLNSSFARDTVKKMFHYSGTDYSSRQLIVERIEKDYPDETNLLVANGSAWYYARFGLVPEEKFFYLPTVRYSVFPDAIDAQAEAVRDGRPDILILEWLSREYQIAMPEGARNEDVLAGLAEHYEEVFSAADISLYRRNDSGLQAG